MSFSGIKFKMIYKQFGSFTSLDILTYQAINAKRFKKGIYSMSYVAYATYDISQTKCQSFLYHQNFPLSLTFSLPPRSTLHSFIPSPL
jgi:hypothetical protein